MNKKLKKANEVLAAAREYAAKVSQRVCEEATEKRRPSWLGSRAVYKIETKEEKKRKYIEEATELIRKGQVDFRTYRKCVVVKMCKGDFRVEADGQTIERRFKSVTAANEWIAKHTK